MNDFWTKIFGLLLCFVFVQSRSYSSLSADIDWTRLQRLGPWHDTIDVPTSPDPALCWNYANFTKTEYGVHILLEVYKPGRKSKFYSIPYRKTEEHGVYEELGGAQRYLNIDHEFEGNKEEERPVEEAEVAQATKVRGIFITDYENYLISVVYRESGFEALVKARTKQISAIQFQLISSVLVEHGFISPVMTLKNECVGKGPAAVVIR